MNKPELTELNIEISATDASEDDLDRMTRQLLSELRDMEVESAELTKGGPAPHGTKSVDPVMMGNIAVAVLPSILPKWWSLCSPGQCVDMGVLLSSKARWEGRSLNLKAPQKICNSFWQYFQRAGRKNERKICPDYC